MSNEMVFLLSADARFSLEMRHPFFERNRVQVLVAKDGEEALRLLQEKHPDIAVLEYRMPVMAGDEVCKVAKADPAVNGTPILMVTEEDEPSAVDRCLAAGCDDIVAKPIEPQVLLEKVLRLLALPVRQSPRIAVRIELTGEQEEGAFIGQSLDLGEGGMLIDTNSPLRVGETVRMTFYLPLTEGKISAEGKVVREARPGLWHRYGIRFLTIDEEGRRGIRQLLRSPSY